MPNGTLDEQEAKWKECLLSIGKKCQVLRSGKALKEELLNPSSSLSDSENLTFSTPSEETTASDSITSANVTLKINDDALEEGQNPTQIDLGKCYFCRFCFVSTARMRRSTLSYRLVTLLMAVT